MSESDDTEGGPESSAEDPPLPKRVARTVTPYWRGDENAEMNTIGWAYLLGLLVLLVPLLPFIVLVWLISKLVELATGRS